MDNNLQILLEEYRLYFSKCEFYLKKFEQSADIFDTQPLNQLRYAGRDLVEGLLTPQDDKEYNEKKVIEAIRHTKRATYDMLEIVIAFYRNRLKKFELDYEGINISKVMPDFYSTAANIKSEGSKIIDRNSGDSYDRKEFEEMDAFILKLEKFDEALIEYRGHLNSMIKKNIRERRFSRGLAIVAILISLSTFTLLLIKWIFYSK